jgi:hypothetical protein
MPSGCPRLATRRPRYEVEALKPNGPRAKAPSVKSSIGTGSPSGSIGGSVVVVVVVVVVVEVVVVGATVVVVVGCVV